MAHEVLPRGRVSVAQNCPKCEAIAEQVRRDNQRVEEKIEELIRAFGEIVAQLAKEQGATDDAT